MAKRQRPDPAITERWITVLRQLSQKLAHRRELVEEAEREFGDAVRSAFAEGVLGGPMKQATGLSGSRLYQIKLEHRGEPHSGAARVLETSPEQVEATNANDDAMLDAATGEGNIVMNGGPEVPRAVPVQDIPDSAVPVALSERGDDMTELICVVCGNVFTYDRDGRGRLPLTCSDECRRKRSNQKTAKWRAVRECPTDKHGTVVGYVNYSCGCDLCRRAYADYRRDLRKRGGNQPKQ